MEQNYSQKTAELLERMCRNVEREDFELDKENSEESILKTYDLFNLPRPKKIIWVKDILDEKFTKSVGSARSAGSAGSAWSARSVGSERSVRSVRSAGSAWSAMSAMSARSAMSAGSAWSAMSAMSARSAMSAGSAWSERSVRSVRSYGFVALDDDFDWYIFEFEYCQNPDKDKLPNDNDFKYLEYCELLMKAKESGLGYRVEWEDVLYLAPTPLIKIDKQNRFHSEISPAIRWKDASEFYYLEGINLLENIWKKVVGKTATFKEIMAIENMEQRMVSLKYLGTDWLLRETKAKEIDRNERGDVLYEIKGIIEKPIKLAKYLDWSTDRVYIDFVLPEHTKIDEALAWKHSFSIEQFLTAEHA